MKHSVVISALAVVLMFVSCKKQETAYDVRLLLNMTVPGNTATGAVRVFAYRSDSGVKAGEFFLTDREGDMFRKEAAIRSGRYDFIGYNFDIPDTFLRGDSSIGTLQVYTNPVPENIRSKFILDPGTTVVYAPDRVVLGTAGGEEITSGRRSLDIIFGNATESWSVEIGTEGVRNVVRAGCILSGELMSKNLSGAKGETGRIYFDLGDGTDCLSADFNTFGRRGVADGEVTVFVYNGEKVFNYTKPVGSLMQEAVRDGSYKIVISDKIVVPAPESSHPDGSGFNPAVGEWKNVYGEIFI